MNRRNFLSTLIGGLAATAAVRSFPFRVFSFPKEIKFVPQLPTDLFFKSCVCNCEAFPERAK